MNRRTMARFPLRLYFQYILSLPTRNRSLGGIVRRHRAAVVVLAVVASMVVTLAPSASAVSRVPGVPASVAVGTFGRAAPAGIPTTARFSYLRKDGNDVRGPLDLGYVRVARGTTKDLLTWGTRGRVSNTQLNPKNGNFAVGIDTNDDRRYDFFQYAFFAAGRLRGVLVNSHTRRVVSRSIPTSRVNARTFKQNVLLSKISNPKTYRFVLFGYYQGAPCSKKRPCDDTIPNRLPLLPLDHAAPTFSGITLSGHSSDARADLTSRMSFTTSDDKHGTGLKSWRVESRPVGTSAWTTAQTGTIASPTVLVPGEGGLYDVRITSTDRQANRRISPISQTLFPFDDTDASIDYSPGTPTQTPTTDALLGSVTSIAMSGTATISFNDGSSVCLLLAPAAGGAPTATVKLDGGPSLADVTESTSTPVRDRSTCYTVIGSGSHTLMLTVTGADVFVLDGYYVEP